MRGGKSQKKSKLPSGTNKNSVDDEGNDAGAPTATATTTTTTQLRHQSYVERRPGAYREGPGGESVLASGPTALVEAVTSSYRQPPNQSLPPSLEPSPSPEVVLLEAEPVWEAEPVLSVVVADGVAATVPDVLANLSTLDGDDDAKSTRSPQQQTPQRQGRRRCRMTRRTVVILLVIAVVAIVVAAVVAGVIVATSKGSNRTNKDPSITGSIGDGGGTLSSSAGSLPPAEAPFSTGTGLHTPAPTTLQQQCPDEYTAFANCITNSGQSTSSCGSCINTYLPNPISTCEESAYYTCYVIALCNYQCGPCTTQYTAISNCMNQGKCPTITC